MGRDDSGPGAVLLVCLGNICRSPLAELAVQLAAERHGLPLTVDSAGTGDWHVGLPPDPRARTEAQRHGFSINHQRARQIAPADFHRFDHVIALDRSVLRDVVALAPAGARAQLSLLLDHVPGREGEDVPDPYYGDATDFAATWALVQLAAEALVARLMGGHIAPRG